MTEKSTEKKARKWGRVVLVASLALNLLVVGVVAGAMWRFGGDQHDRRGSEFSAPFIRALSHADRRAIGKEMRMMREQAKSGRAARNALYEQMSDALRSDPFNMAQVEDLSLRQRSTVNERLTAAQEIWLRHIADMTAQERTEYADRLDGVLARGKQRYEKR
ncbi:MAG: periplasmic heavy metal sensor [Paracoccaceae bacterium]